MEEDVCEEYRSSLEDLTCNSKPLINMLTMLAEENIKQAPKIVQAIESHLQKALPEYKLPVMYLIDSVIKNIGAVYLELFTQNIVSNFCSVFEKVDEKTRIQLFKLRQTWSDLFPNKKLYAVDLRVSQMDPAWPVTAQKPQQQTIHVNPKFLENKQPPAPPPVFGDSPESKMKEIQQAEVRQQLLAKQQELLKLQQQKLELELLQTKARLEEQARLLQLREQQLKQQDPVLPSPVNVQPVPNRVLPVLNAVPASITTTNASPIPVVLSSDPRLARRDPRLSHRDPRLQKSAPAPQHSSAMGMPLLRDPIPVATVPPVTSDPQFHVLYAPKLVSVPPSSRPTQFPIPPAGIQDDAVGKVCSNELNQGLQSANNHPVTSIPPIPIKSHPAADRNFVMSDNVTQPKHGLPENLSLAPKDVTKNVDKQQSAAVNNKAETRSASHREGKISPLPQPERKASPINLPDASRKPSPVNVPDAPRKAHSSEKGKKSSPSPTKLKRDETNKRPESKKTNRGGESKTSKTSPESKVPKHSPEKLERGRTKDGKILNKGESGNKTSPGKGGSDTHKSREATVDKHKTVKSTSKPSKRHNENNKRDARSGHESRSDARPVLHERVQSPNVRVSNRSTKRVDSKKTDQNAAHGKKMDSSQGKVTREKNLVDDLEMVSDEELDLPQWDTDLRVLSSEVPETPDSPDVVVIQDALMSVPSPEVISADGVHLKPAKRQLDVGQSREKVDESKENLYEAPPPKKSKDQERKRLDSLFGEEDQDYRQFSAINPQARSSSHKGWAQYKAAHPDEFKSPLRPAKTNMDICFIDRVGDKDMRQEEVISPPVQLIESRDNMLYNREPKTVHDRFGRPLLSRLQSDFRFNRRGRNRFGGWPQQHQVNLMLTHSDEIRKRAEKQLSCGKLSPDQHRELLAQLQSLVSNQQSRRPDIQKRKWEERRRLLGSILRGNGPHFDFNGPEQAPETDVIEESRLERRFEKSVAQDVGELPTGQDLPDDSPKAQTGPTANSSSSIPPMETNADIITMPLVPPPPPIRSIMIDGKVRTIYFIDNVGIVKMDENDAREITFRGPAKQVFIDDMEPFILEFGQTAEFEVNGKKHTIKFGAPSRELLVDDHPYEARFGGPPVWVVTDGKPYTIRVAGPPPIVHLDDECKMDILRTFLEKEMQPMPPPLQPDSEDQSKETPASKAVEASGQSEEDDSPMHEDSGPVFGAVDVDLRLPQCDAPSSNKSPTCAGQDTAPVSPSRPPQDVDMRQAPAEVDKEAVNPKELRDKSPDKMAEPSNHQKVGEEETLEPMIEEPHMKDVDWRAVLVPPERENPKTVLGAQNSPLRTQEHILDHLTHGDYPAIRSCKDSPHRPDEISTEGQYRSPLRDGYRDSPPHFERERPRESHEERLGSPLHPDVSSWDRGLPPATHRISFLRQDERPHQEWRWKDNANDQRHLEREAFGTNVRDSWRAPYPEHQTHYTVRPEENVPRAPHVYMEAHQPAPVIIHPAARGRWSDGESYSPGEWRLETAKGRGRRDHPFRPRQERHQTGKIGIEEFPSYHQQAGYGRPPYHRGVFRPDAPAAQPFHNNRFGEPHTRGRGPLLRAFPPRGYRGAAHNMFGRGHNDLRPAFMPHVPYGHQEMNVMLPTPATGEIPPGPPPFGAPLPPVGVGSNPFPQAPVPTQINVSDLFQQLVAAGLIKDGQGKEAQPSQTEIPAAEAATDESPAEAEPKKPTKNVIVIPPIDFTPESLKVKYDNVIVALYQGVQCASCGLRFTEDQADKYSQHLDWHFRANRKEKDGAKKAISRRWFYDVEDWIQFEEVEDLEERERNFFDMQADEEQFQGADLAEVRSIPAFGTESENVCVVCSEPFELFWVEEEEEWHLKNAVRVDDKAYHPLCYEDFKKAMEAPETPTPTPSEATVTNPLDEGSKEEVMEETKEEEPTLPESEVKEVGEKEDGKDASPAEIDQAPTEGTADVDLVCTSVEESQPQDAEGMADAAALPGKEQTEEQSVHAEEKEEPATEPLPAIEEETGNFVQYANQEEEPEEPREQRPEPKMVVMQSGGIVMKIRAESMGLLSQGTTTPPGSSKEQPAAKAEETEESEDEFVPPPPDPRFQVMPPVFKGTELSGLCSIM